MKFFTSVPVKAIDTPLNYSTKWTLLGSCFSENIGNQLKQYKCRTLINPLGILYNPIVIANTLNRIYNQKQFTEKDVHQLNEQWFSFHHHTKLNSESKEKHLHKLNNIISDAHQFLQQTDVLILTFGSAFAYQLIDTGEIVANCQKVPQQFFKKIRYTVKQIIEIYEVLLQQLFALNDHLQIIFTVSPVRHTKDGIIENNKSKAILLLAIDYLHRQFGNKTHYFPSYEIMMDELRDYRFYKADLIHPNDTAIQYIWEQFSLAYINEKTTETMQQLDKLLKQVKHKPFRTNTRQHREATHQLIEQLQTFQNAQQIDLSEEMELLFSQLK